MPLVATNWTALVQTGSITVVLVSSTGVQVSNSSQPLFLSAWAIGTLNIVLPGFLQPGPYELTVSLSMNGGVGQGMSGCSVALPAPSLEIGTPPPAPMSLCNLVFEGLVGTNYVIGASSDLKAWQPLTYFALTDSPVFFNDLTATNYNQRFIVL